MKSSNVKILGIGITSLIAFAIMYWWFKSSSEQTGSVGTSDPSVTEVSGAEDSDATGIPSHPATVTGVPKKISADPTSITSVIDNAPENKNEIPSLSEIEEMPTLTISRKDFKTKGLEQRIADGNILQDTTRLNLAWCDLTDLPENITTLQELVYLNISNNNFERIPECLKRLSKLVYLNLSCFTLKNEDLDLLSKIPRLSYLDISYCRLSDESISKLPNLKFLDISGNKLGEKGIEHLSKMSSLTHLRIYNYINDETAKYISKMTNLMCLDVKGSNLSAVGAAEISKLQNLTDLSFISYEISVEAIKKLAKLPNLVTLNISGIEVEGSEIDFYCAIESLLEIETLKKISFPLHPLSRELLVQLLKKANKKGIEVC